MPPSDSARRAGSSFCWELPAIEVAATERLAAGLGISQVLARCLVGRGFDDCERARGFLEPRLSRLGDPFELPGMTAAVARLLAARDRGARVVLFGDYDVDGVTATALLFEVLRDLGWSVAAYLPRRREEGYGLSEEAVRNCREQHPADVLLAVDCGSTSGALIAELTRQGVEVLVCDHHPVGDPAPRAAALVNPHLLGGNGHPARGLCSVGVAFKLAHGLVKAGRQAGRSAEQSYDVRDLLDLVVLGTVADLVPLTGENRILVAAGLARLEKTRRCGLAALLEVARVARPVSAHSVGFQIAPRLNAAGRLEAADRALELLLTEDPETGRRLALALDLQNRERQQIEQQIAATVIESVRRRFRPDSDRVIVEGDSSWHIGVVGIVAARVLREFYRPTLILGGDGEVWRGSGRSIEGFDLASALEACRDLLVRHGGHAMAAGLTLRPEQLSPLRDRLNGLAREQLHTDQLRPLLRVDAEVGLAELTPALFAELESLAPFGAGNPGVLLVVRGLRLAGTPRRIGRAGEHLRLQVTDGGAPAEVLWWGGADRELPTGSFALATRARLNTYQGRESWRLELVDWQ